MSQWWNSYVGIPFEPRGRTDKGLDCYGLLIKVYKEQFGILVPDYLYDSQKEPRNCGDLIANGMNGPMWGRVDGSRMYWQLGDVCIFSLMGTPFHTTILLPKNFMLHCTTSVGVVIEHMSSSWSRRMVGVFRHEKMWSARP